MSRNMNNGSAKSPAELGQMDIKKLLVNYSLPAIVAQMAASLYNIIDSIFIGRGVGALAISGMAVTLPLMNMAAAFGSLVGAGGSTLISIKMGQKDDVGAAHVLGNIAVLNIILGVIVMMVGLVFLDPILNLFGASDDTRPYASSFMTVILLGNVVTHLYFGLNSAMRSSGNPRKAMICTLLTVVCNIVLAPIFIFAFDLGIAGAAMATVLSQTISLAVIVKHFMDKGQFLHFQRFALKLKWSIVKGIFSIGVSPFAIHICSCLVVILVNNKLVYYGGDYAIGAYGNVNKILMLFAMIVLGINQGMQPIAGYNYGAKQYDRVMSVLKYAILFAEIVMVSAFVLAELFPSQIMSVFTTDSKLIADSAYGLRIAISTFPVVGFQMVAINFFQSIGKAFWSAFLSTTRQLLFLVPLLLVLPGYFELFGVWICLPLSDFIAFVVTAILLYRQLREFKKLS